MKTARVWFAVLVGSLLAVGLAFPQDDPQPPQDFLQFDGITNYVEVPDSEDFSVTTTGALTISAWMRPDTLTFPVTEGSQPDQQFVHWLGKGVTGQQEWVFRMYSLTDPAGPRANRISFYIFSFGPPPLRGCGSYFQDPVTAAEWIHVVGVSTYDADNQITTTAIYEDGVARHANSFDGTLVLPQHGTAPLRLGTRDFASFFQGALAKVRIWNRALSDGEIQDLYASDVVPADGIVAEYLLNEGQGDVAHDTAGGHDGAVAGATWGSGSSPINPFIAVQSGGGC